VIEALHVCVYQSVQNHIGDAEEIVVCRQNISTLANFDTNM